MYCPKLEKCGQEVNRKTSHLRMICKYLFHYSGIHGYNSAKRLVYQFDRVFPVLTLSKLAWALFAVSCWAFAGRKLLQHPCAFPSGRQPQLFWVALRFHLQSYKSIWAFESKAENIGALFLSGTFACFLYREDKTTRALHFSPVCAGLWTSPT